MSRWIYETAITAASSPHGGAVLPEGRIAVLLVPIAALIYYYFVVRRNRDR